jgi:hypothetical protein
VLIEGRWGDDDASVTEHAVRAPHILGLGLDKGASFVLRRGGWRPQKLLDMRYRRAEAELPFWGGPPAPRLEELLEASSVCNVVVESLMDPILWSGLPKFPRYVVTGIRAPAQKPA